MKDALRLGVMQTEHNPGDANTAYCNRYAKLKRILTSVVFER